MATAMLALAEGLWAAGAGAAEVKNVTAEYAWPWGVELHYEVVGTMVSGEPFFITATDRANNQTYTASASALSGDTGINAGAHKVLWELDKQGIKLQSTNVVFTVKYEPLYCVVDLSGGANAVSYSVTYMDEPPSGGFNTDAYKTTQLVLKRIPAGTFNMNGSYQVTLSKPFYAGLFEVTQKQWTLVTGSNPPKSTDDTRPAEAVSYDAIRGSSAGAEWPAGNAVDAESFLGKLRARTGLEFDLPTEAQWEYACRAGTTTTYSYGDSANGDYMWYSANSGRQTHVVGTKKANPWGLYDMHGNVQEWCLDWYGKLSAGTDPKGPSSGEYRVVRGGSWFESALIVGTDITTSSYRYPVAPRATYGHYNYPNNEYLGFRLVRTLEK